MPEYLHVYLRAHVPQHPSSTNPPLPRPIKKDEVSGWYHGSNLLRGMHRLPYVAARLRCTPNDPPPPTEPVVALPVEPLDDDEALRAVRDKSGVNLRPLRVEADGSCLVHALSTALTGSQVYFDALRWAAHRELRDHRAFYERAGLVTGADKARLLPRLEAAAEAAKALGLVDRERGMREAAEEVGWGGGKEGGTLGGLYVCACLCMAGSHTLYARPHATGPSVRRPGGAHSQRAAQVDGHHR